MALVLLHPPCSSYDSPYFASAELCSACSSSDVLGQAFSNFHSDYPSCDTLFLYQLHCTPLFANMMILRHLVSCILLFSNMMVLIRLRLSFILFVPLLMVLLACHAIILFWWQLNCIPLVSCIIVLILHHPSCVLLILHPMFLIRHLVTCILHFLTLALAELYFPCSSSDGFDLAFSDLGFAYFSSFFLICHIVTFIMLFTQPSDEPDFSSA